MKRLAILLFVAAACYGQTLPEVKDSDDFRFPVPVAGAAWKKSPSPDLPNPKLTPGLVRPLSTKEVCETKWGLDRRHVTEKMLLQMCANYGMPWHCWGPARRQGAVVDPPAHDVFSVGDGLQVRRIHAMGISASMVQLGSFGDGASEDEPEKNVRTHTGELIATDAKGSSSISARLHSLALPQPTAIDFFDPSEYGFLYRTSSESWSGIAAFSRAESFASLTTSLENVPASNTSPRRNLVGIVIGKTSMATELLTLLPAIIEELYSASLADQTERHEPHFTRKDNPCNHGCEGDHLIPRELGGADDVRNLWPQSWDKPGAHEKDVLENALHRMVCAGKLSLHDAQEMIRQNWFVAYQQIPKPKER